MSTNRSNFSKNLGKVCKEQVAWQNSVASCGHDGQDSHEHVGHWHHRIAAERLTALITVMGKGPKCDSRCCGRVTSTKPRTCLQKSLVQGWIQHFPAKRSERSPIPACHHVCCKDTQGSQQNARAAKNVPRESLSIRTSSK